MTIQELSLPVHGRRHGFEPDESYHLMIGSKYTSGIRWRHPKTLKLYSLSVTADSMYIADLMLVQELVRVGWKAPAQRSWWRDTFDESKPYKLWVKTLDPHNYDIPYHYHTR